MKNNLIKSVVLTIGLVCSVFTFSFSFEASSTSFRGGVTTEGDMLVATTDAPDDVVLRVYVTDESGKVYEFSGCGNDECYIDLSQLTKGNYDVIVVTEDGGFSSQIVLN